MESNKIDYEFANVKKVPIEKSQLKKISEDLTMDKIFNMKGPTFRKLKLNYDDLSKAEKLKLLYENQGMIKRPLLEKKDHYHVGYDEEKILDFVKS